MLTMVSAVSVVITITIFAALKIVFAKRPIDPDKLGAVSAQWIAEHRVE